MEAWNRVMYLNVGLERSGRRDKPKNLDMYKHSPWTGLIGW